MNSFENRGLQQWLLILVCTLTLLRTESGFVDITYVDSAVAKGAVCLDGSPPAYNFDKGSGAGINNWVVHMEGGGWCNNVGSCLERSKGYLGSTKIMAKQVYFSGILSNDSQINPDFYSWNRVKIRYCDGGSFTGDVEEVDPVTKVYYRGARIFLAVIAELLKKGMKNAENAVLNGCSAGGLTSILHCDNFKSLLPKSTKVKCLADAGYFINANDIAGTRSFEDYYNGVVTTHGSAKNLPRSCTSKMKPGLCFFPENIAKGIQTPLFIINSAIDSWQIYNILAPNVADQKGVWKDCKQDITKCSASELQKIQGFDSNFRHALSGLGESKSRGYFINSCFLHCQTEEQLWFGSNSPMLKNKVFSHPVSLFLLVFSFHNPLLQTIAKAAGDWYFDRSPFQEIDCPYPCDRTCPSHSKKKTY